MTGTVNGNGNPDEKREEPFKGQCQQEYWLLSTPSREEYEARLRSFLVIHVKKLDLPASHSNIAFTIYRDILEFIQTTRKRPAFPMFYDSLDTIKGTRFVSAALLLVSLFQQEINVNQKELASLLDLNTTDNVSKAFHSLASFLKHVKKYSFIYRFLPYRTLSKTEFKTAIREYVHHFFPLLRARDVIKAPALENVLSLLDRYFEKIHDTIIDLHLKHPRYLASTLWWIYLIYREDMDLSARKFVDIIQLKKDVKFSRNGTHSQSTSTTDARLASKCKLEFIKWIHSFDLATYKSKVTSYLASYLHVIKLWISQNVPGETRIPALNGLNHAFIDECLELFDIVLEKGFKINLVASNNKFYYYFPQVMALTLLFHVSRSSENLRAMVNVPFFRKILKTHPSLRHCKRSFRYITESENRLYPFMKDARGRFKGQVYSRDSFIQALRTALKKFYHVETDFLLRLYSKTELTPFEFGNLLNIHSGRGVSSILDVVTHQSKFTEPRTFQNIKAFIKSRLPSEDQGEALQWLDTIQHMSHNDFRHGSVTYSFKWIKSRHRSFLNHSLHRFLYQTWKGRYPRHLFIDPQNERASNLKFQGTANEPLKTATIKKYFAPYLTFHDPRHYLSRHVRRVFDHYRTQEIGIKPDHPPILNYILSEEERAIAIEVPVWLECPNASINEYFIGHIDLLLKEGDTLVISDYKPNQWKVLKSIPQITVYAIFLREQLKAHAYNLPLKIKCIGFTNDGAIEWNPDNIFKKIHNFISTQNNLRKNQLLTANRRNKRDLLNILKQINS